MAVLQNPVVLSHNSNSHYNYGYSVMRRVCIVFKLCISYAPGASISDYLHCYGTVCFISSVTHDPSEVRCQYCCCPLRTLTTATGWHLRRSHVALKFLQHRCVYDTLSLFPSCHAECVTKDFIKCVDLYKSYALCEIIDQNAVPYKINNWLGWLGLSLKRYWWISFSYNTKRGVLCFFLISLFMDFWKSVIILSYFPDIAVQLLCIVLCCQDCR